MCVVENKSIVWKKILKEYIKRERETITSIADFVFFVVLRTLLNSFKMAIATR